MEIFIYGVLAHREAKKKAIYDEWAKDEMVLMTAKTELMWIIARVVYSSGYFLREACRGILMAYGIVYREPLPLPF